MYTECSSSPWFLDQGQNLHAVGKPFCHIFNAPNFHVVSPKLRARLVLILVNCFQLITPQLKKHSGTRIYFAVEDSILTSRSGKLNSIFRSNLPGLIRAGSRVSGLFVAISTLMLPRGSKPSSWLISSSIVRCTSLSPPAPSSKRAPRETRHTCLTKRDLQSREDVSQLLHRRHLEKQFTLHTNTC